jgi:hypothetical protein
MTGVRILIARPCSLAMIDRPNFSQMSDLFTWLAYGICSVISATFRKL